MDIKLKLDVIVSFVVSLIQKVKKLFVMNKNSNIESMSEKNKNNHITLDDVLTSSGKYPDRKTHTECTDEVKNNATKLLKKVNALLDELNVEKREVSSGFRPSSVNSAIPNAAKKSLHMQGLAVDISDKDGSLNKLITEHSELLVKYKLWLESGESTVGWTHLDCSETRKERLVRIFKP
jgi:uncharacterized protein YcbK (DUF882 family)